MIAYLVPIPGHLFTSIITASLLGVTSIAVYIVASAHYSIKCGVIIDRFTSAMFLDAWYLHRQLPQYCTCKYLQCVVFRVSALYSHGYGDSIGRTLLILITTLDLSS